MIDPADRFLMVHLRWPNGWDGWVLPGGGIEAGESAVDALRREISEETGVAESFIGPPVARRRHVRADMIEGFDGQEEVIHLVPCRSSELSPALSAEELLAENVVAMRWWTIAEMSATAERLRPEGLIELALQVLEFGAPESIETIETIDDWPAESWG